MVTGYAIVHCRTYEEAEILNKYWDQCGYKVPDETERYLWDYYQEHTAYFLDDWGYGELEATYGNYNDIHTDIINPSPEQYEFVGDFEEYASMNGLCPKQISIDVSEYL